MKKRVQSWPKKCVLGCVIPPAGAEARSRNLGHTFFGQLCTCMMLHRLPHIAFVPNKLTFSEDYLGTLLEFKKKIFLGRGAQQLGCHVRDRRLVRGQR